MAKALDPYLKLLLQNGTWKPTSGYNTTDQALLEYSSRYKCILATQLEFQTINSNLQAQI
jgi:hypothetical protein